jgi:hypothetical protein
MIDKVLRRQEFAERPPVLLDIGAAGEIHPKWKRIAPYSVCIAFDADERELGFTKKETGAYRKMCVYNCIASEATAGYADFFLTHSPHCSSLLKPQKDRLNVWAFSDLFEVERKSRMKTVPLSKVMEDAGAGKIDWFKSDSQGTDLRLFRSLGENGVDRVLVAEFEPGIIDAYEGEDKLWGILAYMEKRPFWMADLAIKGSQRIRRESIPDHSSLLLRRFAPVVLKTSPGWGEMTYINTFPPDAEYLDKRDYLLGWVFSMVEKQYGFALEIASRGLCRFDDPVFLELEGDTLSRIRLAFLKLPYIASKFIVGRLADIVRKKL